MINIDDLVWLYRDSDYKRIVGRVVIGRATCHHHLYVIHNDKIYLRLPAELQLLTNEEKVLYMFESDSLCK